SGRGGTVAAPQLEAPLSIRGGEQCALSEAREVARRRVLDTRGDIAQFPEPVEVDPRFQPILHRPEIQGISDGRELRGEAVDPVSWRSSALVRAGIGP